MTAVRLQLRPGALIWQRTAVCEPDLDTVAASAAEVERWGGGLPFDTRALASTELDGVAFTLIATPETGLVWLSTSALRRGDLDGCLQLVASTPAYAVRTRYTWLPRRDDRDERPIDWIAVDHDPDDTAWLFLRRVADGVAAGPLSRVAVIDIVERWLAAEAPAAARDADANRAPTALADSAETDADGAPSALGDAAELRPPDASGIDALLRFLRMAPPDSDAAREVTRADAALGERRDTADALDLRAADDAGEWRLPDDLPGAATTPPGAIAVDPARGTSDTADGSRMTGETRAEPSPAMSTATAQDASDEPGRASRVMARSRGSAFDLPDVPSTLRGVPSPPGELSRGAPALSSGTRASSMAAGTMSRTEANALAAAADAAQRAGSPAAPSSTTSNASGANDPANRHASTSGTGGTLLASQRRGESDIADSGVRSAAAASNATDAMRARRASNATDATPGTTAPTAARNAASSAATRNASDATDAADASRREIAKSAAPTTTAAGTRDTGNVASVAHEGSDAADSHDARSAAVEAGAMRRSRSDVPQRSVGANAAGATHHKDMALAASTDAMERAIAPTSAGMNAAHAPGAHAIQRGRVLDASSASTTSASDTARMTPTRSATADHASTASREPSISANAIGAPTSAAAPSQASMPGRGRVAVARRGDRELALPALPPIEAQRAAIGQPRADARSRASRAAAASPGSASPRSAGPDTAASPEAAGARSAAAESAAAAPFADAPDRPAPTDRAAANARSPGSTATAAEHAAAPFATATIFAMNAEPARRVPPALAADGAPIAAVIATAREPATSVAAPSARREINREIRVGDVSVELGEPMPPRPSIEHAGSLLASIPRPGWQPRRRL